LAALRSIKYANKIYGILRVHVSNCKIKEKGVKYRFLGMSKLVSENRPSDGLLALPQTTVAKKDA